MSVKELMKLRPVVEKVYKTLNDKQIQGLTACLVWVANGDIEVDDVIRACVKLRQERL